LSGAQDQRGANATSGSLSGAQDQRGANATSGGLSGAQDQRGANAWSGSLSGKKERRSKMLGIKGKVDTDLEKFDEACHFVPSGMNVWEGRQI